MLVLVVVSDPWPSVVVCAVAVVDEAAADALSVLSVMSVVLELVVFADTECVVPADGVLFAAFEVVLGVVPTTTPGLVVGIVTEAAAEEALSAMAEDDSATVVVVFAAVVGHSACIIPPFITIPSNVLELTETSEQASLTSLATEFSAD